MKPTFNHPQLELFQPYLDKFEAFLLTRSETDGFIHIKKFIKATEPEGTWEMLKHIVQAWDYYKDDLAGKKPSSKRLRREGKLPYKRQCEYVKTETDKQLELLMQAYLVNRVVK